MPTGIEISREFINGSLLPQLKRAMPKAINRLAVGIVGVGSDVLGLDDDISRDHHWGPRATILYPLSEQEELAAPIKDFLEKQLSREYCGFRVAVNLSNLTGVCHSTIEGFFTEFLGTAELPRCNADWLKLCEVDLLHVTGGEIVFDGPGEMTRRRQALAYYPDIVWRKKIADWCMYVTGRDAPYNVHRISKRHDHLTATIYFGQCVRRLMEICFALNRRYAPYSKWLNKTFRQLPKYAGQLAPWIDKAFDTADWDKRVLALIEASYVIAYALADVGLTDRPDRKVFDEQLTDLTLYHSAAQIYATMPPELFSSSFNQIELWEKKSREVLFDKQDYFQDKS